MELLLTAEVVPEPALSDKCAFQCYTLSKGLEDLFATW